MTELDARGPKAFLVGAAPLLPSVGRDIGRDLQVLEGELGDPLEGGSRDDAAVDRSVRLVDRDEHYETRAAGRHESDERGDVARSRVAAVTVGLLRGPG